MPFFHLQFAMSKSKKNVPSTRSEILENKLIKSRHKIWGNRRDILVSGENWKLKLNDFEPIKPDNLGAK